MIKWIQIDWFISCETWGTSFSHGARRASRLLSQHFGWILKLLRISWWYLDATHHASVPVCGGWAHQRVANSWSSKQALNIAAAWNHQKNHFLWLLIHCIQQYGVQVSFEAGDGHPCPLDGSWCALSTPPNLIFVWVFFLKRRYRFFIVCQSVRSCQNNYLKSWCPEVSSFQISFSADWLLFVVENRPYKQEHHFTQATLVKARVGLLCISDGAQTKQVSRSMSWLQNIHCTFPSKEDLLLQGAAALP